MKTSFKKIVATASIAALVAMNVITGVQAETPTASISGDDIIITDTRIEVAMDENNLSVHVKDSADVDVAVTSVITEDTLTLTTGGIVGTVYSVSYIYDDGTTKFVGSVVVDNMADGAAGSHSVSVTATVVPILSMSIQGENYAGTNAGVTFTPTVGADADNFQNGDNVVLEKADGTIFETTVASVTANTSVTLSIDPSTNDYTMIRLASKNDIAFGELVPNTPNTQELNLRTATNAIGGITVVMGANGLATGGTVNDKHIGNLQNTASVKATGINRYQVQAGKIAALTNVAATNTILDNTNANTVTLANKITKVELEVEVDELTEAGNYSDTLTFSITGTF